MKKQIRLLTVLFIALFMLSCVPAIFADIEDRADPSYYVYDDANLLSGGQWEKLNQRAKEISDKYECSLYIVTVDDFTDYTNDGDPLSAAENIYTGMDFGYGNGRDGQLLLLSMDDRDYAMIAYGDFANYAFTDYGKDLIIDEFLDDFRNDDWYGGFEDYLEESARLLDAAKAGTPVDIWIPDDPTVDPYPVEPYKPTLSDYIHRFLMFLFPGSLGSLVTCSILRSKSKTVRTATNANRYVDRGLSLYASNEHFLHRSTSRRVIQRDTGHSGGGGGGGHFGGTTVSSSGFSGKSGKF